MRDWQSFAAVAGLACALAACGTATNGGGYYPPDAADPFQYEDVPVVASDVVAADVPAAPHDVVVATPDVPAQPDVPVVQDQAAPEDLFAPDVPAVDDAPAAPDVPVVADIPVAADTTKPGDIGGEIAPNTCGAGHDVLSLLACTEGSVDFQLSKVLVTYVFPAGFLVFDASTTRGMMIYVGSTPGYPNPKVGDIVSLHVSKYASFNGQQEVTGSDGLTFSGSGDAAATALDLATIGKSMISADYESRLLKGKGLTVKSLAGLDGVVTTPGAGDLPLRIDSGAKLCTGSTFDLVSGALTQFSSAMRVQIMNGNADIANADTSKCTTATYDTSNWGFETVDATDPPPGFFKNGVALMATRTTAQAHTGVGSAQLTWTSADNQDFVAGYLQPIAPGQTANLGVWVLDNDPGGKARLALVFLKSDQTTVISTQYQATYTTDSPTWAQKTYSFVAPAEAAYVRGFVRLYDVTPPVAGTATVYVDDFTLTAQ